MIRIIFSLLLSIAALFSTAAVAQSGVQLADNAPDSYTVVKGDTLWKIAASQYGNGAKYPLIFEANKPMLKDPDRIYPGQNLRIPPL